MKIKKVGRSVELTGSKKELDHFAFQYACTHPIKPRWDVLSRKAYFH